MSHRWTAVDTSPANQHINVKHNYARTRKSVRDESTPAQSQSFFRKRYQRAKEIYQNRLPGESQMLWAGVRSYLNERETGVVFEMCSPKRTCEAMHEPSSESAVECQAADQPLRQPPAMAHGVSGGADKPRTRQGSAVSYSDISRTSREVPIKIRRTVLTVDTNNFFPLSPPSSAAPKQRTQKAKDKVLDVNKPLPRAPFPCFSDIPKPIQEPVDESPVDPPWSPTHMQTVGLEPSVYQPEAPRQGNEERSKNAEQETQPTIWLKASTKKPLNAHLHSTGKSKPSKADKAHDALKAKISRPLPIPPSVNLSPTRLAPYPGTMSEKAKGKQKIHSSLTWLNKLVHPTMPTLPTMHKMKKRPNSDESFACQGLGEGDVYAEIMGDGGLSVQEGEPRMREMDLQPAPLFTGTDAGGRRWSDESCWDVLDVYADQRRTGRWI